MLGLAISFEVNAQIDWKPSIQAVTDDYAIPGYQSLAAKASSFSDQAEKLCKQPDQAQLDETRQAFHQVNDSWQWVNQLSFGPADNYMRRHRIELWPDKHGTGAKQIRAMMANQDMEKLAPDTFTNGSVAIQGLPAAERLLFGKDVSAATFGTADSPSYHCEFLLAIARNLSIMAEDIQAEWTSGKPPFSELITSASEENIYFSSDEEVASLLLRDMSTGIQIIKDLKLKRPMGDSAKKAKPRRAESWRSGRSLKNIRINLEAGQALYAAAYAPVLKSGSPQVSELDSKIGTAFDAAIAATAFDGTLHDAVRSPDLRPQVDRLWEAVHALLDLIGGELPGALDLAIGFNSLDGD